jgi:hypothetical protein
MTQSSQITEFKSEKQTLGTKKKFTTSEFLPAVLPA